MRWVLSGVTLSIEAVKEFSFKSTDEILIDANVWICIFSDGLKLEEQAYSAALSRILAAQSTVYIDALIISKVVNALTQDIGSTTNEERGNSRRFVRALHSGLWLLT